MTREELLRRLADIEWDDWEVKEAAGGLPQNAYETISAFANTSGGWLVLGVRQKGTQFEVTGVGDPAKIESDLLTSIRAGKFNRIVDIDPLKHDIDGRTVLAFHVREQSKGGKPVYFNSPKNTFIRTGSGDQRATREEVDALYRSSSFESRDVETTRLTAGDVDTETLRSYRNHFTSRNAGHPYAGMDDVTFLEKLNAVSDGKLTYGGC